jgi:hypothetical protein
MDEAPALSEFFYDVHNGCGTCGAHFEDLETDIVPAFMPLTAFSSNISEYNVESEHFIFHENMHDYLFDNVSPANFNLFMARMDLAYKAMYDLVGAKPIGGAKLILNNMDECPTGSYNTAGQHAHVGEVPYICWNPDPVRTSGIIGTLRSIEATNASHWRFMSTMHELGHMFHGWYGWQFNIEYWANQLAFYAIKRCGGVWDNINSCTMNIMMSTTGGNVGAFIHPLFTNDPYNYLDWDNDSFEHGWSVLQQVFRTYPDASDFSKSQEQMLVDFVARIAYFLDMDLDTYLNTYVTEANRANFPNVSPGNFVPCPDCGFIPCQCCPDCGKDCVKCPDCGDCFTEACEGCCKDCTGCVNCFIPCTNCACGCSGYGKCNGDCCKQPLYGDVDGDCRINSADVTLLRRYIAAEDKETFVKATGFIEVNAKVAGNKDISAADVTMLRRYIAVSGGSRPVLGVRQT